MRLVVDPRRLLSLVLDHREDFPKAHAILPAIATKLATEEIKSKPTDLRFLQKIHDALGAQDFALVLDAVPATNFSKLVKTVDKDNPNLRGAKPEWLRERYIYLVEGGAAFQKPAKTPASARSKSNKSGAPPKAVAPKRETNPTKAKSSKAVWDGKNRDAEG